MEAEWTEGSCVCGKVRFRVRPPFVFFQYCHCSRCQKVTGSAHSASLFVGVEQFEWISGEELVKRYELPSAKYFCTGFCSVCGSRMPWLSRNGRFVLVPAGTLDSDPGVRPEQNIYWSSKATWYLPVDELDTFDEKP